MSDRSKRMYGKSPKMERDEHGEMSVKKHEAKEKEAGADGSMREEGEHTMRHSRERMAMHHRHVKEHLELHHKHEVEHSHHKGSLEEIHERHEKEYSDMHHKHHSEMKKMHAKHENEEGEGMHEGEMNSDESGDKIIEKIESKKKEGE